MTVTDQIVQAAKDLGLPPKTEHYIRSADKAVTSAVQKAAAYADSNRDTLAGYVDKAGAFVDERTGGKYHDKVTKAAAAAATGVTKLAEKGAAVRSSGSADSGMPSGHAGAESTTPVWDNPTDLDESASGSSTQH